MTDSVLADPVILTAAVPASARTSLLRRVLRDPMALGALVVLSMVVLAAIFAPWLTSWDPNRAALSDVLAPPFGDHLLGADSAGRDVLARLLAGARVSLLGAIIALAVAQVIGIPSGLVAGYYRGWFDSVASWWANLLMSVPGLIVLLAVISVIGPGVVGVMTVFGVLLSPGVFRLTRSSVIAVSSELYIDAARVSGLSDARIIARHVLGVIRAPLVIQGSIMAGIAIVLQSGLEFLGVGDSSTPSWGQMLNDAFSNIYVARHLLIWPGAMIVITVGSLAIIGTAVRDAVQGTGSTPRRRPRPIDPKVRPDPLPQVEAADEMSADAVLEVRGLRIGYPQDSGETKIVVDGVSLHVDRGEVLGLVGESGSGKTQTAFAVLGLLPTEGRIVGGTIRFDGRRIDDASARSVAQLRGRRIGYVPQEPMSNLDPCFTLGYQLVEPIRRHLGLGRADAKKRALALLDRVGIADPVRTFGAYPHQVSGGMAQRVLIAGAVSCDPELLIADEPTTALDVTVQADVLDLLRSLQQEHSMGMILVTHNFGVVADLCDRVAVMQDGRIVEQGTVVELFDRPQHPYTRMLLDSTLEDSEPRAELVSTGQRP